MKLKFYFFVVFVISSVMFSGAIFALDNNAEESLARGKRFFADGRYEDAMDNFINVFVSGNTEQIAEANEYVNLIHYDRGGVVAPKQVPYEGVDKQQNVGTKGKILKSKSSETQVTVQNDDGETSKQVFVKEEKNIVAEPPSFEREADPFGSNKTAKISSVQTKQSEEKIFTRSSDEIYEDKPDTSDEELSNESEEMQGEMLEDRYESDEDVPADTAVAGENEFIVLEDGVNVEPGKNIISNETESSFPTGNKIKLRSKQKKEQDQKRKELIESLVTKLNANDEVQVYMRNGRVDAIDINSSALFLGGDMDKVSSPILDDAYALMILEDSPAYVILPEGSYTDDVTLHGVRQAVALNTYFINRGISPSRMSLNMGLTTQEPPEKFSDLEGVSIVFDYEGKSHLKSKLQEKNLPPVLSLAIYPFNEITPSAGEVFVIDFSVIEASSQIKNWVLQIVSHASDKHYYVVKQLSGNHPLNHQTFWNGRKGYFGHLLPSGKYTIVLKAVDTEGRERILKRKVVLKDEPINKEDIVMKTESEVLKEEESKVKGEKTKLQGNYSKNNKEESNLDYSQKRLWTKPGRKQVGNIDDIEETVQKSSVITTQSENTVYQSSETSSSSNVIQGQETTTESNSYSTTGDSYISNSSEEESNPYEI